MYMQIIWERGNVWRKYRKEGKVGENIGERGYVWRKIMEEMVCLKKILEKGYVNRKYEREREYVVYALESGGGGFFRVCLENICKREYVWMFGEILFKGFVWRKY